MSIGVAAGDHVAVVLGNFPAYVALKYAIARIGAVAVPINYSLRRQELSYILGQSDSKVLVTMDRLRDRDYLQDLDALAPGWERSGGGQLWPQLRNVVVHSTDRAGRTGALSLEDVRGLGTKYSTSDLARRETEADPHFRADIIYTSGTTGLPKGVMLSHDMILRAAYASAYTRAFEDGRRIMFSLPMYHVFGYVECLVACTFVGGAIIPQVFFDAQKMLEGAEVHGANELVCVPTMTLKLLEVARSRGFDGSKLQAVFNSGGISPPSIWQDIRTVLGAREVLTAYGMTETTASTSCTLPEESDGYLLSTNGRMKFAGIAGSPELKGILAAYKTIDPATGADLPPGASGELVARGPIVTSGYYKKDDETRAAFTPDGWLHTGDIGIVSADGYLALTGRLKETYRCGGEMVMPREIEDLLLTHPGVAQALVVGLPDLKMGEVGCICVVRSGNAHPTAEELIDFCKERLARFKVPKHVLFLTEEEIPTTATGKAQKFKLAELARRLLAERA
jgi:fatty-acyl-CoA synthase